MKNKQNTTIKELCELTYKIIEVEYSGKAAVRILSAEERKDRYEKIRNLSKEDQIKEKEKQNNERGFSQEEIYYILEHKEFFKQNHYDKICALIGEESGIDLSKAIEDKISKKGKKYEKKDHKNSSDFLSVITEFTDERRFFTEQEITASSEKLIDLCGSVENICLFLGTHAIKAAKQPIHDLVISFELPEDVEGNKAEWNKDKWFTLCIKENRALKLLSRADDIEKTLGHVPNSYRDGMSVLRTISYARAKDIESIEQSDLSDVMSKEKLYRYTELCIEHSISNNVYGKGLDILINPMLKTKDNLPDITIDGSELGKEFAKYYMTKLPINDVRGLILGKLTNCCQSIDDNGKNAAIDGMKNENSGFYVICEKGKSGKIDIENDRIIAQSYTWLGIDGAKGKSLVFDSWERLGKDNDKLLDPFYSRFADIIHKQEVGKEKGKITKITIGTGGNTPGSKYLPFTEDLQPTQFNGIAPYNDAQSQYVILDINRDEIEQHISPEKTKLNILFLDALYNSDTKLIESLLNQSSDKITSETKGTALEYAAIYDEIEIYHLLLEQESSNITFKAKGKVLFDALKYNKTKNLKLLLEKEPSEEELNKIASEAFIYIVEAYNIDLAASLLKNKAYKISEEAISRGFTDTASLDKIEMVKLLLENKYYKIPEEAISKAFEDAVFYENKKIVELLLKDETYNIPKKGIFNGFKNAVIYERLELLKLLFNEFDISSEEQNNLFISAIQNLDNRVSKFLINKCGSNLDEGSIREAFSSDHIKDDLNMYKLVVKHVPDSVIELVNFDNENNRLNFAKNIVKARVEISLSKANNRNSTEANFVTNFQTKPKERG